MDNANVGVYTFNNTTANTPVSVNRTGFCIVLSDGGNLREQIFFVPDSTSVYVRYRASTGWLEWKKVG